MHTMKTTIIISVYKNVKALKLVLDSVLNQSYKVDEIIISEDGNSNVMKELISRLNITNLIHLTQEDLGWRKNIALNNSIRIASSSYLIFIDGDVVLHKRFIEGHIKCSQENFVCVGKRVELGQLFSKKILDGILTVDKVANGFIRNIISLHKDKVHHYEDGIYSTLLNKLTASRKIRHIIGCNFSCFKKDLEKINGFNEDFKNPAEGEDVDITWRLRGLGVEMKSCRYIANVYHLWHKKGFGEADGKINRNIMHLNQEKKQYICLNGLNKIEGKQT